MAGTAANPGLGMGSGFRRAEAYGGARPRGRRYGRYLTGAQVGYWHRRRQLCGVDILSRPAYARWRAGYAALRASVANAPPGRAAVISNRIVQHVRQLGELSRNDPQLAPVYRAIAAENGLGMGAGLLGRATRETTVRGSRRGKWPQCGRDPSNSP